MKREQKIVAVGAASGVAAMVASLYALSVYVIPAPAIADDIASRLAYALGANAFALIPLVAMLIAVGNSRFFTDAIDPTRHAENASQEINGRVASNTLEQNFIFLVASLTVATTIPLAYLQIIWAAAIVFVIARVAFWIGYRMHPLYRAPGFAVTAYLNLGLLLYALYSIFF